MSALHDPLTLRGITLRNRIGVSPMCQYSSIDGLSSDWHLVHLGSRAVGGAGLVCVEASAVTAVGRISKGDLGIYDDRHVPGLERITRFVSGQGAVPAIQLAHAGRKASTQVPWEGGKPLAAGEAWTTIAPSAIPFADGYSIPHVMTTAEIGGLIRHFSLAAVRALAAGFKVVEIHAAHGYLLHEFLSPLANQRTDDYGGSFANRTRLLVEVAKGVRTVWPDKLPLFVRLSCSDWMEGGWTIDESVALARLLKEAGVDLIDCSSGGMVPNAKIPLGPGYQVPFSERIRAEAGIPTAAVGMITQAQQADELIRSGKGDLVLMAREFLRDPYWPLHHLAELQGTPPVPKQYGRAFG